MDSAGSKRRMQGGNTATGGFKRSRAEEGGAAAFRFLINNAIAGIVIGKGGETAKGIRDGCGVNLNIIKVEGVTDRVMEVTGAASATANAIGMVLQSIEASNAKQQNQTSTDVRLLVHSMHCGAIIGKGGATIKETMSSTGANIQISQEVLPGSTEKVCDIAGSNAEIQAAISIVLSQLEQNPIRPGVVLMPYLSGQRGGAGVGPPPNPYQQQENPYSAAALYGMDPYAAAAVAAPTHASMGGMGAMGAHGMGAMGGMAGLAGMGAYGMEQADLKGPQSESELSIPSSSAGAVIGKAGATIKYIQASSACTVVMDDRAAEEDGTRKIRIKGPSGGIQMAIYLIRQAVEQQKQMFQQQGEYGTGAGAVPAAGGQGQESHQLIIEAAQAGLLIGKKGATMQEIKKYSGVQVLDIATATEEDPTHRTVTLKGSAFTVQCALSLIQQKLNERSARFSQFSEFSGAAAASNPNPTGESSTLQVAIPSSMAGAVIGKGGNTVRDLKAATNCSIVIDRPTAENPQERVITITGTNTEYAALLIQNLVSPS